MRLDELPFERDWGHYWDMAIIAGTGIRVLRRRGRNEYIVRCGEEHWGEPYNMLDPATTQAVIFHLMQEQPPKMSELTTKQKLGYWLASKLDKREGWLWRLACKLTDAKK